MVFNYKKFVKHFGGKCVEIVDVCENENKLKVGKSKLKKKK